MKTSLDNYPAFKTVLELVKRLSKDEKIKLSKELEKELLDIQFTRLLRIFKTNELSEKDITTATESVRASIYGRSKSN